MRQTIRCGSCPLIVLLTLLSEWMTNVHGQHLPTRDENNFHFYIDHKELFYDTKMLPDGAQVTAYIYNGTQNSYFFLVEEAKAPMTLTVSPCASAVDWQVSWMEWTDEETSGDQTEDDLLFRQKHTARAQTTILKPFSDSGYSTYATNSSLAGLYVLMLRAIDGDTSVHVYATTTPDSDRLHPELPSNTAVNVVSVTRHSVSLMWKPSPTATLHGQPVHYCVAVNAKQNFQSQCSAIAHIYGDTPPTVPPFAGFGFAWESTGGDVTERPAVVKSAHQQTSWYRCVGRKTTFTFLHGEPGKRYYFDVFAVHTATNVSSSYNGTSAKTKTHARYTPLKANRPRRYYVRRFKVERSFVYNMTADTPMLLFTVQPCATRVLVGLYRTSTLIQRVAVRRVQTLAIGHPAPGPYMLTVSAPTDASFSFNIIVTPRQRTRLGRLPYPSLPADTSVRVSGRTSHSMNISWHGTRDRQQYCLYKRAIDIGPLGRRDAPMFRHEQDVCEGPRNRLKTDKVRCRNFKARRRRRSVVTETVTGLRSDTLYVFDVYARRRGGLTLPYRRTWAKTKSDY